MNSEIRQLESGIKASYNRRVGDEQKPGLHAMRSEIGIYYHEVEIAFTKIETINSET